MDYYDQAIRENENDRITLTGLAISLAGDYSSVYYLNMKTGAYSEYAISETGDDLKVLSCGRDFFADTLVNCPKLVYKDDQKQFLAKINRERFEQVMQTGESFTMTYRLVIDGKPVYYQLKTIRSSEPGNHHLLVGVRCIDRDVRAWKEEKKEIEVYNHIATALARRYEVIYYVNIITDRYKEYASSEKYSKLDVSAEGTDFFADTERNMQEDIFPEDYPMMSAVMDKDRFLSLLERDTVVSVTYRLMVEGKPEYMNLRAVMAENDTRHVVIGVSNIDSTMRRESELKAAVDLASKDALTGVKNKHAYLNAVKELDTQIKNGATPEFALLVCDINGLKQVNDVLGHMEGDAFIQKACRLICQTYKHSPVYRIGGDEFVVLLKGDDYRNRDSLFAEMRKLMDKNKKEQEVTMATGMSSFDPSADGCADEVFQRADNLMYQNKKIMKQE